MRRSMGALEALVEDAVRKAYVDGYTAARSGYTPPSGGWQMPSNPMVTVDAGTLVSGTVYYMPYDIGPNSMTITGISAAVTTAQVGGTVVNSLGLYLDDGSGGYPDMTNATGKIGSGTFVATSLGIKTVSISATLTPGRYWTAFLYYASAAPTTAPQFTRASAAGNLWEASTATAWAHRRGIAIASQTALPTTQVTLAPNNNQSALVGIKRA